jgi:hypothetical protein
MKKQNFSFPLRFHPQYKFFESFTGSLCREEATRVRRECPLKTWRTALSPGLA